MLRMAVDIHMTTYGSLLYNAGVRQVGFTPTRQRLLAPSEKIPRGTGARSRAKGEPNPAKNSLVKHACNLMDEAFYCRGSL